MKSDAPLEGTRAARWAKRVAWLLALWAAGVAILGVAAWALKAVMRAVGLAA